MSFLFGVTFLMAALGILVLPSLFFTADIGAMRIGASVLFAALASYLLWFASRGTQPDVHFDTKNAEIREVVSHRVGRPTVVAIYGFDRVAGVFLDGEEGAELAVLWMRCDGVPRQIALAEGPAGPLQSLRDKIQGDLQKRGAFKGASG